MPPKISSEIIDNERYLDNEVTKINVVSPFRDVTYAIPHFLITALAFAVSIIHFAISGIVVVWIASIMWSGYAFIFFGAPTFYIYMACASTYFIVGMTFVFNKLVASGQASNNVTIIHVFANAILAVLNFVAYKVVSRLDVNMTNVRDNLNSIYEQIQVYEDDFDKSTVDEADALFGQANWQKSSDTERLAWLNGLKANGLDVAMDWLLNLFLISLTLHTTQALVLTAKWIAVPMLGIDAQDHTITDLDYEAEFVSEDVENVMRMRAMANLRMREAEEAKQRTKKAQDQFDELEKKKNMTEDAISDLSNAKNEEKEKTRQMKRAVSAADKASEYSEKKREANEKKRNEWMAKRQK